MKTTLTLSIRFQSSICALLLISALSGSAHAQWASDSTFNTADWYSTIIPVYSSPSAQLSIPGSNPPCVYGQDSNNGNPFPSRRTCTYYPNPSPPPPPSIWVAHLYQPVSSFYTPSIQGAIAGVSFSYDLSPPTQSVTYGLLLFQNGVYFRSVNLNPPNAPNDTPGAPPAPPPPPWKHIQHANYTAEDFRVVDNLGNDKRRPDFSCTGSVIQFGYVTGTSSGNHWSDSLLDNWKVDIIKGKPCCGAINKSEIRCNEAGGFTYNFEVTNTSTKPTQYILLSPPPGATYTISPSSINTPLNPGQSTTVSVNITNASPNANICIDVLLADKEVKPCCKLQTCLPAPECPCLKRLKETVECGPVGGSYTYTVQLQNLTGFPIQQIFVIPTSPAGITVTPSVVPVTLPAYGQASFQVTITGAAPGSTVVLQLAPSGAEPLCCSMQIRFNVPGQGQC